MCLYGSALLSAETSRRPGLRVIRRSIVRASSAGSARVGGHVGVAAARGVEREVLLLALSPALGRTTPKTLRRGCVGGPYVERAGLGCERRSCVLRGAHRIRGSKSGFEQDRVGEPPGSPEARPAAPLFVLRPTAPQFLPDAPPFVLRPTTLLFFVLRPHPSPFCFATRCDFLLFCGLLRLFLFCAQPRLPFCFAPRHAPFLFYGLPPPAPCCDFLFIL